MLSSILLVAHFYNPQNTEPYIGSAWGNTDINNPLVVQAGVRYYGQPSCSVYNVNTTDISSISVTIGVTGRPDIGPMQLDVVTTEYPTYVFVSWPHGWTVGSVGSQNVITYTVNLIGRPQLVLVTYTMVTA